MTKIQVYLVNGVVFEYEVASPTKGREHAHAIITTGYRHTAENSQDLEWYPPQAVLKVKVEGGGESAYKDKARGT